MLNQILKKVGLGDSEELNDEGGISSPSADGWAKLVRSGSDNRKTTIILAVAIVLLAMQLMSKDVTTVAIPPQMNEELVIIGNTASEPFDKGWGEHVAVLAGNISRDNAEFVKEEMNKLLAPGLRTQYLVEADVQIERLALREITETFVPIDVQYVHEIDRVYVYGEKEILSQRTGRGTPIKWTYEIKIVMNNGQPVVTYFGSYQGMPNISLQADYALPQEDTVEEQPVEQTTTSQEQGDG